MPAEILRTLGELARRWWPLATAWHAYVVALGVAVIAGWRPPRRLAAVLILLPVASVAVMAFLTANLFTSIFLGGYVGAAGAVVVRMPARRIRIGEPRRVLSGTIFLLFGFVYPHFLGHAAWLKYLYAAPLGIVPCPTLAGAIGASLVLDSLGARSWSLLLGATSGFYGVFGALRLGVSLDWVLVAAALLLLTSPPGTWRTSGQAASPFGAGRPL